MMSVPTSPLAPRNILHAVGDKSYAKLRADHVAEHQRLFNRVELNLGTSEAASRPTDERIKNFADGKDPQLAALYFQLVATS